MKNELYSILYLRVDTYMYRNSTYVCLPRCSELSIGRQCSNGARIERHLSLLGKEEVPMLPT